MLLCLCLRLHQHQERVRNLSSLPTLYGQMHMNLHSVCPHIMLANSWQRLEYVMVGDHVCNGAMVQAWRETATMLIIPFVRSHGRSGTKLQ
eukprot:SAG31_NODE_1888_length_6987_cov_1.481852_4_plen_91_part_00